MTPMNPNWTELKKQPFGEFIPDEVLQYRSDEVEKIIEWSKEHHIELPAEIEIVNKRLQVIKL